MDRNPRSKAARPAADRIHKQDLWILAHRALLGQTLAPGLIHALGNAAQSLRGGLLRLEQATRVLEGLAGDPPAAPPMGGYPPADVERVLADLEAWQRCQLLLPRVPVLFQPHEPLPPARVDPAQLLQALAAIVTSAKEAIGEGGNGTIRVSAEAGGPWIFLTVSDDGPAIAADAPGALFEPVRTTEAGGRQPGLGLAVARILMRRAGGDVSIGRSRQPAGTHVMVRVPAVVPRTAPEPRPADQEQPV